MASQNSRTTNSGAGGEGKLSKLIRGNDLSFPTMVVGFDGSEQSVGDYITFAADVLKGGQLFSEDHIAAD